MKIRTALVIPDCHIPYHDARAYQLMLDVSTDIGADEVVILGDYADFYAINAHGKNPDLTHVLQDEVFETIEHLKQLKKLFPKAKKVYIQGNHEFRLERYIKSKAPDLFGVTDTKTILELKLLGFEYVPYGPNQKYSILGTDLYARHEPLAGGKHVAQNTVEKAMCSMIFGHTHRLQEAQTVTADGRNLRGISSGWLGDKHHPVMQYVKGHHQWAQGVSIVRSLPYGTWWNQLVHIIDYKCIVDGHLYEG
jgi:UDP-2,3-diacylglucosamine pyrophosphatase LpxH